MDAGDLLEVRATDTAAPADFEAFSRETGHELLGIEESEGVYLIRLRKSEHRKVRSGGRGRARAGTSRTA